MKKFLVIISFMLLITLGIVSCGKNEVNNQVTDITNNEEQQSDNENVEQDNQEEDKEEEKKSNSKFFDFLHNAKGANDKEKKVATMASGLALGRKRYGSN